jgi:hypothetical protein
MKKLAFIATCAGLLLFAGCTTPEARIKRQPELFASLSTSDQQLIREGKVALGFTPEMVKLALGDPDRISTRTDASGVSEAWSYTTFETDYGMPLYRGYYHRYYGGWGDPFFPYYLDYSVRRDREYFKVRFTGGRVSAIEQNT